MRTKQPDTDWKEETTGLAIELAGMVIEAMHSRAKTKTFHVDRIAGKLQKIIDKERAAERQRMVELYKPILEVAMYLADMEKEIPGDMWTRAEKAMETIGRLRKEKHG